GGADKDGELHDARRVIGRVLDARAKTDLPVQIFLLEIVEQRGGPTPARPLVGIRAGIRVWITGVIARRKRAHSIVIGVQPQADLLEVVLAFDSIGGLAGSL